MKYRAIKTIEYRFRERGAGYPGIEKLGKITESYELYQQARVILDMEVVEKFYVLWLDTEMKLIGFELVSMGMLNSSLVYPREVFRGAIIASCRSIILVHNHPSGNLNPSDEDINLTKQLIEAGKIIGIPVQDHLIISSQGYRSMLEKNDCVFRSREVN